MTRDSIDRGEAETLLEGLVGIESPSGRESEASRFLVDWMARRGFEAEVDAVGNAVGARGAGLSIRAAMEPWIWPG